ncbi:LOW QUALITY PROTEIN: YNG2-like protein, partial [Mya arenaria]
MKYATSTSVPPRPCRSDLILTCYTCTAICQKTKTLQHLLIMRYKHLFFKFSFNRKPALLSIVKEHSNAYVPKTVATKYPIMINNLREKDAISLNYAELSKRCNDINIEVYEEEVSNVEKATKNTLNLWYDFRAGRITASKMKNACHTDPSNPSQSLIINCYPQRNKFSNMAKSRGLSKEKVARSTLLNILIGAHENVELEDSGLCISTDSPHVAASPDGIITCDCCGRSCVEVAILPEMVSKFYSKLPSSDLSVSDKGDTLKIPVVTKNALQDTTKQTQEICTGGDQVESGQMVVCDNENCKIVWFHFTCLKLTNKPKAKKWYCPDCRRLPECSKKETSYL